MHEANRRGRSGVAAPNRRPIKTRVEPRRHRLPECTIMGSPRPSDVPSRNLDMRRAI